MSIVYLLGKEVKLLTHVENEELFIGLLGVLALAAVLFFSMLGCFVVGLMKRHHESVMQRNMVTMLQAQMSNPPLERRYSRKGSVKEQKRPVLMQSLSNQSTTALLSYQSAGYPQTGDHVWLSRDVLNPRPGLHGSNCLADFYIFQYVLFELVLW